MVISIQKEDVVHIALGTGLVLMLPLVAMFLSDSVVWDLADFIIAGCLLAGAGLLFKIVTGKVIQFDESASVDTSYRFAGGFAVFAVLALVWINLAVGIIGSENNTANLMYLGVIAVGFIGAFIARLRSHRMVYVMLAMAFAQTLTVIIALVGGMHHYPGASIAEIVNLNGFFVMLFLLSAQLFRFSGGAADQAN